MIQSSIYGRIGKPPKPGATKSGTAMCTASLAVDVGREPGQETLWVTVMAFGPLAEALARHQQGDMVAAMGKLTRGRYTGQDGQERESWSLLADALHSSRTVRPGRRRQGDERHGTAAKSNASPNSNSNSNGNSNSNTGSNANGNGTGTSPRHSNTGPADSWGAYAPPGADFDDPLPF